MMQPGSPPSAVPPPAPVPSTPAAPKQPSAAGPGFAAAATRAQREGRLLPAWQVALALLLLTAGLAALGAALGGVIGLTAAGGLGLLVTILGTYFRLGQVEAKPVAMKWPQPNAAALIAEAESQARLIRRRLWKGILLSAWIPLAYALVWLLLISALLALTLWAGPRLTDMHRDWTLLNFLSWPPYSRFLGYLGYLGAALFAMTAILLQYRIVSALREGRTLTRADIAMEFDRAMSHGGVVGSALAAATFTLVTVVAFGGSLAAIGSLWIAFGLAEPPVAYLLAVLPATLLFWAVLTPALATPALMVHRDPGWLSSLETSIGLCVLHPHMARAIFGRAAFWGLTVIRWPDAMWLLLAFVRQQEGPVSVLMRERRPADVIKELETTGDIHETALEDAARMIEQGRYLDALNICQMALRNNRLNAQAWEGVAMAQLHIGNQRSGREAVERILSLEPENPLGLELAAQLQQGLWNEGGALLQAARARCRQQIGQGIE